MLFLSVQQDLDIHGKAAAVVQVPQGHQHPGATWKNRLARTVDVFAECFSRMLGVASHLKGSIIKLSGILGTKRLSQIDLKWFADAISGEIFQASCNTQSVFTRAPIILGDERPIRFMF